MLTGMSGFKHLIVEIQDTKLNYTTLHYTTLHSTPLKNRNPSCLQKSVALKVILQRTNCTLKENGSRQSSVPILGDKTFPWSNTFWHWCKNWKNGGNGYSVLRSFFCFSIIFDEKIICMRIITNIIGILNKLRDCIKD